MADNSKIEWTDATWGPIRARLKEPIAKMVNGELVSVDKRWGYHCERISPGCKHCYASTMNGRMLPAWGTGLDYTVPNREKVEIFLDEKELLKPLKWKKPRKVFPCSMTDWCADFVTDEMRDRMLAVAALCPQHTFLFLTKRAERCAEYWSTGPSYDFPGCSARYRDILNAADRHVRGRFPKTCSIGISDPQRFPFRNVFLGFSAENQECFDARWKHMRKMAAAGWRVWCSAEPLLGPIDISAADGLSWCVVGGESGHGAREMYPDWARSIRDQCGASGVPFFFKQWGGVRKKEAGRMLDGREWSQFPKEMKHE